MNVSLRIVALCGVVLTGAACDNHWDLDIEVVVGAELQRDRPLHVVVYSAATEQIPAGSGAPTGQASMTSRTDEIPPPPVKLWYREPTCFHASKAFVVAWAPAPDGAPVDPEGWRQPRPGDYSASSGWIDKDPCGGSETQHLRLTLEEVE